MLFTCSMHPEIVRPTPGNCPLCGMTLEPLERSGSESEDKESNSVRWRFWTALALGFPVIFFGMAPMLFMMLGYHEFASAMSSKWTSIVQLVFTIPILFWAGAPIWSKAGTSFRSGKLNMFSLIALGTGITFFYSAWEFFSATEHTQTIPALYFEAAAMMMIFVLLGQFLEERGRHQAGSALRELLELIPNEVTLFKNGIEKKVLVNALQVGDVIRLHPGEKIPVDGKVIEGASAVNESMLTGEVFPIEKSVGSAVTAGTLNIHGSFLMTVEKTGGNTLLAQMIAMVVAAQRSRAPLQNLTDRVAAIVVPSVIVIALMTFLAWWLFAPTFGVSFALARAVSVLMITCPCALGLATPMALAVGMGVAARHGILVRDVAALQQLASVTIMAFDKTGTLTEGRLEVESVAHFQENTADEEWLSLLVSAERRSEHPLAQAVVRYAEGKNLLEHETSFFEAQPGGGIRAEADGKRVLAGSEDFLKSQSVAFPSSNIDDDRGVVFVAINEKLAGALFFKDNIKASVRSSLEQLSSLGIEPAMLTGDREVVAYSLAQEVGIKLWKAALLPQQKADQILAWKKEGKHVGMAGDGINDAQALSVADASIAMHLGSNIAKETASITLMQASLEGIISAVVLSRSILKTIRENLIFAFGYNLLAIPLAAGIFFKWGIVLNPMVAAAAMSLSSVSVVGNSLRLKSLTIP